MSPFSSFTLTISVLKNFFSFIATPMVSRMPLQISTQSKNPEKKQVLK